MSRSGSPQSRRTFLGSLTAGAVAAGATPLALSAESRRQARPLIRNRPHAANDQIQLAVIGAGAMGTADTMTALRVPGVRLVAACDVYDGRLSAARERFGADIFTSRDYREILARDDIDAVIVGTPDHWHQRISVDALRAGQ